MEEFPFELIEPVSTEKERKIGRSNRASGPDSLVRPRPLAADGPTGDASVAASLGTVSPRFTTLGFTGRAAAAAVAVEQVSSLKSWVLS